MDYRNVPISFPGLFGDWRFTASGKLADIGNGIYWYGVLIAAGMLLALWFCGKQAHRYGLTEDNIFDSLLCVMPVGIVGARLYYVLFYLDLYRRADGSLDFGAMVRIWDGGLAIYGGVLFGVLTAYVFSRVKKLSFLALTDCLMPGLMLGQAIGRWGNFMNREAYGGYTDLPWRMRLWFSESYYIDVHPTFFYESLWNIIGFLLIVLLVSRIRRFDGENTCFYFLWYGVGRFFIEGLRADSLYLFDWTLLGQPIRVSQALSVLLVAASLTALFVMLRVRRADPANLYVNRVKGESES